MKTDFIMNNIIEESLKKSLSYQEYRDTLKQLVETKSTTGKDKSDDRVSYTLLNDRRMKRWDKTVKVSQELKDKITNFNKKVTWLVIAESWCGDGANLLPVMNKVAELNHNITFRVVLRDENEALMDLFSTNGAKSIPKLIMIENKTGQVVNTYGPRSSVPTMMVNDYKKEHRNLTPQFKEDLQRWYNLDKGQNILEDLTEILYEITPSVCL